MRRQTRRRKEPGAPPAPWIAPAERELRARLAARPAAPPSLLERLLRDLAGDGRFWVSFDDLAGLLARVPDLRLPIDLLMHASPFCLAAKADPRSHRDCVRNKHAVNRLALRRGSGFVGRCHLGLVDIVEPLVVDGRVLGTFFCGAVVADGDDPVPRLHALTRRRGVDGAPLLRELAQVRRAPAADLDAAREKLRTIAEVVARIVEAWGQPTAGGAAGVASRVWFKSESLPVPLTRALDLLRARYDGPVQLATIAAELGVTADHLGRLFPRHLGRSFQDYLADLRVVRARRLLEAGFSAGEVAHQTGFSDQAHFGRVFKRLTGMTPKQYARRPPP